MLPGFLQLHGFEMDFAAFTIESFNSLTIFSVHTYTHLCRVRPLASESVKSLLLLVLQIECFINTGNNIQVIS